MTIQELGSLGEFVAAIATIATVVYLAIQVRSSRLAFEDSQEREALAQEHASNEYFNQLRMAVAQNGELADIEYRGTQDLDLLTDIEQRRFHQFMTSWIWAIHKAYLQSVANSIRVDFLVALDIHFNTYAKGRGFYKWWEEHKLEFVDPEFREAIDEVIQNANKEQ